MPCPPEILERDKTKAKIMRVAQQHFGERMFDDIILIGFADEILALHDKEMERLANQLGVSTVPADYFEKSSKELVDFAKSASEQDCDCRHCQSELWILDTDRDIWIKK